MTLKRIRVYIKGQGRGEFGTPSWCIKWLIEDQPTFFVVLVNHFNRGVVIQCHSKSKYYYKEDNDPAEFN